MSQLYRLFCEGLQTASVKDGLSSTFLVTSTPQEDYDNPCSSVQAQVGSDETENPGARSPCPKNSIPVINSSVHVVQHATDSEKPVQPSSPSEDSELERSVHRSPCTCPASNDSSETDFEGAAEFYRKVTCATQATEAARQPILPTARRSRSVSKESEMQLVLESSSSTDDVEIQELDQSPSAARCRIFVKARVEESCDEADQLRSDSEISEMSANQARRQQPIQPESEILKGVIAYVEVRSGHDNRSMGVQSKLRALGATVLLKMSKEVTHVVFNEGAPSTVNRARAQGCHLVSVQWIEECILAHGIVQEEKYPPLNLQVYNEPLIGKRYRKMKSLQPDFEEGKNEERINNYIKRRRIKTKQKPTSQSCSKENSAKDADVKPGYIVPDGVILKELSIILNRVDTNMSSKLSPATKKKKRKLLPLHGHHHLSEPLEDFDSSEHLRPENPYKNVSLQKKRVVPILRRVRKSGPGTPHSSQRRSSCFVRRTQASVGSQARAKKGKQKMRTMVCTFMHRRDIDVVAAVIKQLGGWILEPVVSQRTTHVICGDNKRTINLLRGIAHGCWILHQEWVMRSLEAGHWLDEEPFELTAFPAIQQCRIARETLGVCPNIFSTSGAIFVSKNTTPPQSDLVDLLELCGAQVVTSARQAKLIIGNHGRKTSLNAATELKEQWVLDSIQENMLQPFRFYLL